METKIEEVNLWEKGLILRGIQVDKTFHWAWEKAKQQHIVAFGSLVSLEADFWTKQCNWLYSGETDKEKRSNPKLPISEIKGGI